jgi:uncharacterized membrane protein
MEADTLLPLIAATVIFVGGHFALSSPGLRASLIGRLGLGVYLVGYTLFALTSFVAMNLAFTRAPYIGLWPKGDWAWYLALMVMPFASILVFCALTTPNPTAVGGGRLMALDDTARGIFAVTRHPLMWGVALWAVVHLLATGDGAAVIFFGGLAVLALGGMVHSDRRRDRLMPKGWERYRRASSMVPFAAAFAGRARISLTGIGWWRIASGLVLFGALLFGHEWAIGLRVAPV